MKSFGWRNVPHLFPAGEELKIKFYCYDGNSKLKILKVFRQNSSQSPQLPLISWFCKILCNTNIIRGNIIVWWGPCVLSHNFMFQLECLNNVALCDLEYCPRSKKKSYSCWLWGHKSIGYWEKITNIYFSLPSLLLYKYKGRTSGSRCSCLVSHCLTKCVSSVWEMSHCVRDINYTYDAHFTKLTFQCNQTMIENL